MATLTKKQKQIYEYIKKYIHKNGISPTFEEIKKHLRLKAISTISEHIDELIEKGFKVVRIWEHEIKNMDLNDLQNKLREVKNGN